MTNKNHFSSLRRLLAALIPFATVLLLVLMSPAVAAAGNLEARVVVPQGEGGSAVVWLEGLEGPVPSRDTVLTHRPGGHYEPRVSVAFVGGEFVLRNEDDTLHNIHLYLELAYQKAASQRPLDHGATLYNIALPIKGMEVRRPIKAYHRYREDTGFISVVCNPHPDEKAYVLAFDHPYAAVTGDDGTAAIPDVPAGRHAVRVWHAGRVSDGGMLEFQDDAATKTVIELERGP